MFITLDTLSSNSYKSKKSEPKTERITIEPKVEKEEIISKEEKQKTLNNLAKTFCENRQGEYIYGDWFCINCVNLDSVIKMFKSAGSVEITNAKKPPTEETCKETAKLCLQVFSKEDCVRVSEQKVWIGMEYRQLYISMGVPKDKNDTVGSWGVHSQWVYGDFGPYIYLEGRNKSDLVVTSWQD